MKQLQLLNKNNELTETAVNAIRTLDAEETLIKAKRKELNEALLNAMQENEIIKFENDDLSIRYIQPTHREYFDSKKFRSDHEDLYNDYITMRNVSPSVRIKVK